MKYNEIEDAIKRGEIKAEWLAHESISVRIALAEQNYRPDVLVHDENYWVVQEVLEQNPDLVFKLLGKPNKLRDVRSFFNDQMYISKDALQQYLEDVKKYAPDTIDDMPELYVKLAALEYEPTTMEITMTPKQLYDMGSPLWARSIKPRKIAYLLNGQMRPEDLDTKGNIAWNTSTNTKTLLTQ